LESTLDIDTKYGDLKLMVFKETNTGIAHIALKKGSWGPDEEILTRVHSSSNIAEIFAFFLKDTNRIIHDTMRLLEEEGKGVLILLRQKENENEITDIVDNLNQQKKDGKAYNPFFKRNMENEQKDFGIGAQILHDLNIRKIKLLTNNPKKRVGLIGYDLEIVDNIPIIR
jgi:3,4-dihydroxy 2-butanone 4-phosphate synthase/GTP cyclohydrolase II